MMTMTPNSDDHLVEHTLEHVELLKGHFLHAFRDTVRLPSGDTATREFVIHPGAVMIIAMRDDGRLVMERQYRYPVQQVMIEFPAGKLDPQEGALACGKRELREETGCAVKVVNALPAASPNSARCIAGSRAMS